MESQALDEKPYMYEYTALSRGAFLNARIAVPVNGRAELPAVQSRETAGRGSRLSVLTRRLLASQPILWSRYAAARHR